MDKRTEVSQEGSEGKTAEPTAKRNGIVGAAILVIALAIVACLFGMSNCSADGAGQGGGKDEAVQSDVSKEKEEGSETSEKEGSESEEPSSEDKAEEGKEPEEEGPSQVSPEPSGDVQQPLPQTPSNSNPSGSSSVTQQPANPATPPQADPDPAPAPQPDPEPDPEPPVHEHSWQAVTEQVWVVDQAAWTEFLYEEKAICVCNGCGADITDDPSGHLEASGPFGQCQSWRGEYLTIQTGTIEHPEQGHYETVTVGYSCGCGETR